MCELWPVGSLAYLRYAERKLTNARVVAEADCVIVLSLYQLSHRLNSYMRCPCRVYPPSNQCWHSRDLIFLFKLTVGSETPSSFSVEICTLAARWNSKGQDPRLVFSVFLLSVVDLVVEGLRCVVLSRDLCHKFLLLADSNTVRGIETCGILCGKLVRSYFIFNRMLWAVLASLR